MKKLTILFFLFLISLTFSCQYTQKEIIYKETEVLYNLNNEPITNNNSNDIIILTNIKEKNLIIENSLDYKINLKIYYTGNYTSFFIFKKTLQQEIIIEIEPYDSKKITLDKKFDFIQIDKYEFVKNEYTYSQIEKIPEEITICKKCGEIDCIDDYMECSYDHECGSGDCFNGVCTDNRVYYIKNHSICKDGIYCFKDCVKKGTKEEGEKIVCSHVECKSNYAENKICKYTIEQKITKGLIILSSFVIIFALLFIKTNRLIKLFFILLTIILALVFYEQNDLINFLEKNMFEILLISIILASILPIILFLISIKYPEIICPKCISFFSTTTISNNEIDSYEKTTTSVRKEDQNRIYVRKIFEKKYKVNVFEKKRKCKKCNHISVEKYEKYKLLSTHLKDIDIYEKEEEEEKRYPFGKR